MNEQLTGSHFLGGLALDLWHDDTSTHGRSKIGPHMFVPGTERLRMGVLATLADIAAGIPASGPINPTIDIQVTMLAPPPTSGTIEVVCHPVKEGRRLFLGEVLMHTGSEAEPFAHGLATYMNQAASHSRVHAGYHWPQEFVSSFEEIMDMQSVGTPDAPAFEIEHHRGVTNSSGSIQGGAQAMLVEIAAGHVLPEGDWVAVEFDIRFVNRVKVGPLRAVPERLPGRLGDDFWVRVPLMEGEDRLDALGNVRFAPAEALGG